MKIIKFILSLYLIATLANLLSAQSIVPVYLEPNVRTPILTRLHHTDSAISNAQAIDNKTLSKNGWKISQYSGRFTGFTPQRALDASGNLKTGSDLYLRANTNSPILTTIEGGDDYKIIRKGEWVEVQFEKPVQVYFRDGTQILNAPQTPMKRIAAPAKNIQQKAPEVKTDDTFNEVTILGDVPDQLSVNTKEEAPVTNFNQPIADESIPELDPLGVGNTNADPMVVKKPQQKPASTLSRNYEGTLIYKPKAFIFVKNPYPHQLLNDKGQRLAFLDLSSVPYEKLYLFRNEAVTVYGRLIPTNEKKKDIVIKATNIRLRVVEISKAQ